MKRSNRAIAVVVGLLMVTTACGGGDSKKSSSGDKAGSTAAAKGGTATAQALFYQDTPEGGKGGFSEVRVRMASSDEKTLRVGFTEDEVAGTGDQWRAAGWSATTVATLLTGAALTGREVTFDVSGRIDGPSAGALMTVSVLALIRGDKLKTDITMTGTINPDGTIGPVGGIPLKLDGAIAAKKKRMLVPVGQRNSTHPGTGEMVDVVVAGRKKGIEVIEVDNIYEVYKAFTGKTLPRPVPGEDVTLNEKSYKRLEAKTNTWLAEYQAAASSWASLPPELQAELDLTDAQETADRAGRLSQQGLQAGAYSAAIEAAALANALVKVGEGLTSYLTGGAAAFLAKIEASQSITGKVNALVDSLQTFDPETVGDAAALIDAYTAAIDAVSLASFAEGQLNIDGLGEEEALSQLSLAALFYEIAGSMVEAAGDSVEIGRGLGGVKLAKDLNLDSVADFFRKSGEANLAAFDTVVLGPAASSQGVSIDIMKNAFANKDIEYALALSGSGVMANLEEYFGDLDTSAFASLGGALALYGRTSGLMARYYSLGELTDEAGNVVGVENEKALTASLELAQDQLGRSITLLRSKKVEPVPVVGAYEVGGIDREGDTEDKLSALVSYWNGFVGSRILTYLGGFSTAGLK